MDEHLYWKECIRKDGCFRKQLLLFWVHIHGVLRNMFQVDLDIIFQIMMF